MEAHRERVTYSPSGSSLSSRREDGGQGDRPEVDRRLVEIDLFVQMRTEEFATAEPLPRDLGMAGLVGIPQFVAAQTG